MNQTVNFRELPSDDVHAARALAERVRQSALTWLPDRPETSGTASRLVIGVVVWSVYDLRLLSLVNEAVTSGKQLALDVAVFNLDELVSPSELHCFFPATGMYEPPPVCDWAPGQIKDAAMRFAEELQSILPGIGEVYQPPAVGYWETGQLKETASGFAGRQLVGRLLGFDPQLALVQPAQTTG